MGLFRHNDDNDQHLRFKMRQNMISIGDDYWIEDDSGERVYRVNGKAARVRDTWVLEDRSGHEIAKIRAKMVSVRDTITIEIGDQKATVKKALIGIRDRFHVEVEHGKDLETHGNVVDHEYEIERDGEKIAAVSKSWFRVRDTYGIEIFDPKATVMVLAITVAIDALSHDHR